MVENVFRIGRHCPVSRPSPSPLGQGGAGATEPSDGYRYISKQLGEPRCGICPELPIANPYRTLSKEAARAQHRSTTEAAAEESGAVWQRAAASTCSGARKQFKHGFGWTINDPRSRKSRSQPARSKPSSARQHNPQAVDALLDNLAAKWECAQQVQRSRVASSHHSEVRSSIIEEAGGVSRGAEKRKMLLIDDLTQELSTRLGNLMRTDFKAHRLTEAGLNQHQILLELAAYLDQIKKPSGASEKERAEVMKLMQEPTQKFMQEQIKRPEKPVNALEEDQVRKLIQAAVQDCRTPSRNSGGQFHKDLQAIEEASQQQQAARATSRPRPRSAVASRGAAWNQYPMAGSLGAHSGEGSEKQKNAEQAFPLAIRSAPLPGTPAPQSPLALESLVVGSAPRTTPTPSQPMPKRRPQSARMWRAVRAGLPPSGGGGAIEASVPNRCQQ